jgi:aryl-alcohol dehydrogenase-like predicted oxidoreductase/choline dehydrogenase-like flavoprotein
MSASWRAGEEALMTITSAGELPRDPELRADICIIGSGAAGLTIARQLDGTGIDTLVLEAGGMSRDADTERDVFGIEHLGLPYLNLEPSRARFFGGSTNLWFGRIAALDRIDYECRDWVQHSGWPISYEDLSPWVERAAGLLSVRHFGAIDVSSWAPNPTIESFHDVDGAALGVFLWTHDIPMARHRAVLRRSRNVRVLLDATVTSLVPNEAGTAIESLAALAAGGRRITVRADTVVLAAGGLENPRLLLASTVRSPAGLGNERDLVGRYYMDHPRAEGLATADISQATADQLTRLSLLGELAAGPFGPVQLRIQFAEERQRREHLLNHSAHAHLVAAEQATAGFQSAKRLAQRARRTGAVEPTPLWPDVRNVVRDVPSLSALAVKKATGRLRPTSVVFVDQMEQAPNPASRITVDHRRMDRYGLPQIQVHWRVDESTYESQRRMHELVRTLMLRIDIGSFRSQLLDEPGDRPDLLDMKHPCGTTRMATSASDGVVDPDGKVHGIANLYIAGSSVFPTAGHANPTLTLVALAARLADRLASVSERSRPPSMELLPSAEPGVGCARLGEATNGVSWRQAIRILREAADGGVTFFDTANAYTNGTSERLIGEAFRRRRDEVTIATKAGYSFRERSRAEARARFLVGPIVRRLGRGAVQSATTAETKYAVQDFSPSALRRDLEASLRRLRTDHVDVWQMHAPRDADVSSVMDLAQELKSAGMIRQFGIAVDELDEIEPWIDSPGLDSIQLSFSVVDQASAPIIARARANGVSIIARGVLGQGWLAGSTRFPPGPEVQQLATDLGRCAQEHGITLQQLAMAYAAGRQGIEVILIGVRLPAHLTSLLASAQFCTPDPALLAEIEEVVQRHRTRPETRV